MKRSKKGQLQSQIFVYLLALIVISLVLLYGYSAIRGFMKRSDEVNLVQFKTDFANAIEQQSHEFRSVIKKRILLPRGFNKILVLDLKKNPDTAFKNEYPIIADSWEAGVNKNIYLLGKNKYEGFLAEGTEIRSGEYLLINAPDRVVELKLTGMGGTTIVEEWS